MKKKIADFKTYDDSPYIEVRGVYRNWSGKRHKSVTGLAGNGEKVTVTQEFEFRYGDNAQFTKLYLGNHEVLSGLSNVGIRLFFYICDKLLKKDIWVVHIKQSVVMKELGYKTNKSIIDAVIDLLDKGIISRMVGSGEYFFINPNVFFRGDRLEVYNTNAAGFQAHIALVDNAKKSNSLGLQPNSNFDNEQNNH